MTDTIVTRAEFVRRLMSNAGLTYVAACSAYDVLITTLEDAVVNGQRVNFGRLGALKPVVFKSRSVHMGFRRSKDKVDKVSRTYFLGRRIRYRFQIYDKFARTHELRWSTRAGSGN